MKLLTPLLLMATITVAITACSKDDDAPVNLAGTTWTDSANVSGVAYKPFTIKFNADGSAAVTFPGYSPFPGSWNKSATSDTVYIFFDESATTTWKGKGVLTSGNTKIENGTLTRTAPSVITGTFRVTKQ